MKRCLILLTSFMLLLGVSAFSQGNEVWIGFNDNAIQDPDPDTVFIGEMNILDIFFANTGTIAGLSCGFTFINSAGGTFSWDGTYGSQGTPAVLEVHGPAIGAFNVLFLVNTAALPGQISWGGAALPAAGIPVSAVPLRVYSMRLDMHGNNVNTPAGFVVDNVPTPPATWEFTIGGIGVAPDYQGNPNTAVNIPDAPPVPFDAYVRPCINPVFTNVPPLNVNRSHCLTYTFDFDATEGGNNPPADPVTFSTSAGTINPTTGELTVNPIPTCGSTDVTVTATNDCQGTANYSFTINWTNNNPNITNCPPGVILVGMGNAVSRDLDAIDPDPCDALVWSVVANDPVVNAPTIDGLGNFNWLSDLTEGGTTKTFTVTVTDPCGGQATCNITIEVLTTQPFVIQIEKTHNSFQGMFEYVSITKVAGSECIGGFDFLVAYDASALTLMSAELGADLGPAGLGWEYFTYRHGPWGNCGNACPSGMVRLVAIADINNGANHPSGFCLPDGAEMVELKFYVTNDRTYECMYVPIRFVWLDCGDNALSSVTGDTLFISSQVFDFENTDPINDPNYEITDMSCYFAFSYGGACADCDVSDKTEPVRFILFWNGGIDIVCADSIDAPGDLNLNGIPNEIADAVLFTNYFLYGYAALSSDPQTRQAQIAASDVNRDGIPLSVGDLVYLIRIIVGDALPFPKLAPFANTVNVNLANGTLTANSSVDLGAVYATFQVNGAYDIVSHTDMEVVSGTSDGLLKVLVYSGLSNMSNRIDAGASDLFTVSGEVELVSVDVADFNGNMLNTQISKSVLPTAFALSQNVPNPFNPTTKIGLDLPTVSDWKVDVYNVAGQLVKSFSGNGVGSVTVEWDASGSPSGVYFYKAIAGQWSDTKKMVLMK